MFLRLFQNLMRPCALIVPDSHMITETLLCCHGFQEYKQMAKKIMFMLKMLKSQVCLFYTTILIIIIFGKKGGGGGGGGG